jgi:hypothetical protein
MYLREGEVNPGDEAKVIQYEKNIRMETRCFGGKLREDAVEGPNCYRHYQTRKWLQRILVRGSQMRVPEKSLGRLYSSKSNCWDCMHDPCACNPPLVWDDEENGCYSFFLSCDGRTKRNTWMTQPTGAIATINYKRGEKRKKDMIEKEKEEYKCVENQRSAQEYGYCCHQHATVANKEDDE